MSLDITCRGHIEGIAERGRRTVLMIAVDADDAARIVEALGRKPERHHPAPVVLGLGRAAGILGGISAEFAHTPPVQVLLDGHPAAFDLGAAVAAIAEATLTLHVWGDLAAAQPPGPARSFAERNRSEKAAHLRELQEELTAEFRATLAGEPE